MSQGNPRQPRPDQGTEVGVATRLLTAVFTGVLLARAAVSRFGGMLTGGIVRAARAQVRFSVPPAVAKGLNRVLGTEQTAGPIEFPFLLLPVIVLGWCAVLLPFLAILATLRVFGFVLRPLRPALAAGARLVGRGFDRPRRAIEFLIERMAAVARVLRRDMAHSAKQGWRGVTAVLGRLWAGGQLGWAFFVAGSDLAEDLGWKGLCWLGRLIMSVGRAFAFGFRLFAQALKTDTFGARNVIGRLTRRLFTMARLSGYLTLRLSQIVLTCARALGAATTRVSQELKSTLGPPARQVARVVGVIGLIAGSLTVIGYIGLAAHPIVGILLLLGLGLAASPITNRQAAGTIPTDQADWAGLVLRLAHRWLWVPIGRTSRVVAVALGRGSAAVARRLATFVMLTYRTSAANARGVWAHVNRAWGGVNTALSAIGAGCRWIWRRWDALAELLVDRFAHLLVRLLGQTKLAGRAIKAMLGWVWASCMVPGRGVGHALKVAGLALGHILQVFGVPVGHALKVLDQAAGHAVKVLVLAVSHGLKMVGRLPRKVIVGGLLLLTYLPGLTFPLYAAQLPKDSPGLSAGAFSFLWLGLNVALATAFVLFRLLLWLIGGVVLAIRRFTGSVTTASRRARYQATRSSDVWLASAAATTGSAATVSPQIPFTMAVYENEYLPENGTEVHAVITVAAARPVARVDDEAGEPEAAEVILLDCSGSMGNPPESWKRRGGRLRPPSIACATARGSRSCAARSKPKCSTRVTGSRQPPRRPGERPSEPLDSCGQKAAQRWANGYFWPGSCLRRSRKRSRTRSC